MFCCFFFFSCIFSLIFFFFFSSRRRHTRSLCDWSSDVCSSDLLAWAKGDLDTGEAAVERALRCALDEDAWALATAIRAVILDLRGRLDKAAAVLTEALERPLSPAN